MTAIILAAKLVEVNVPELSDFTYLTKNIYTAKQVKNMELIIAQSLRYNLISCDIDPLVQAIKLSKSNIYPLLKHVFHNIKLNGLYAGEMDYYELSRYVTNSNVQVKRVLFQ